MVVPLGQDAGFLSGSDERGPERLDGARTVQSVELCLAGNAVQRFVLRRRPFRQPEPGRAFDVGPRR